MLPHAPHLVRRLFGHAAADPGQAGHLAAAVHGRRRQSDSGRRTLLPGETTASSAKGRSARTHGRPLDVIYRRRRERGGGFAGSGRRRKQMDGDGDLGGPCSCESALEQTKEIFGTLNFRPYVSLLSNPLQYGVKPEPRASYVRALPQTTSSSSPHHLRSLEIVSHYVALG